MSIDTYILLGAVLIMIWVLAGRWEWRVPPHLVRHLKGLRSNDKNRDMLTDNQYVSVFAADQADLQEIEKEVYLVRKNKPSCDQEVMMLIYLKTEAGLDHTALAKVKTCLERRFPDLTVHFITDGKEEGDCISI